MRKCLLVNLFVSFIIPLCLIVYSGFGIAKNILITDIAKSASNEWQVTYKSKVPIQSLQFVITRDFSRHDRWTIVEQGFELSQLAGKDSVFRRDGTAFTEVTFQLTPTYTHLPKYYAPFSPFSEGSMVFHSARFFACANLCLSNENTWYIRVTVPDRDTILFSGNVVKNQASWYDSNDGTKVFVGQLKPIHNSHFSAVIDPALPSAIVENLSAFLPKAMEVLANQLKANSKHPMLFASFGPTDDGEYGRQGGVLPNQIFMHWYGKITPINQYELLWFYAHEAVHVYQDIAAANIAEKDAWIHEGHAEYLASKLLEQFLPASKPYILSRLNQAEAECKQVLETTSLDVLAENGEYQALYYCGLQFYQLAELYSKDKEIGYKLWQHLARDKGTERQIDAKSLLTVLSNYIDDEGLVRIKAELGI